MNQEKLLEGGAADALGSGGPGRAATSKLQQVASAALTKARWCLHWAHPTLQRGPWPWRGACSLPDRTSSGRGNRTACIESLPDQKVKKYTHGMVWSRRVLPPSQTLLWQQLKHQGRALQTQALNCVSLEILWDGRLSKCTLQNTTSTNAVSSEGVVSAREVHACN